jgi:hypothetical protein
MLTIIIKANTDTEGAIEVVESIAPAVMREGLRSSQGAYWEVSVEGTPDGTDENHPYNTLPPPAGDAQPSLFHFDGPAAAAAGDTRPEGR